MTDISLHATTSAWGIATAATRQTEDTAAVLVELAHAICNVTVYEDGELELAIREALPVETQDEDKRRRAIRQLGNLLILAAGTPSVQGDQP